jgi:sensor histidine kinase regulating citrate/malate metabolism
VHVTLQMHESPTLSIRDTGSAIAADVAADLFRAPVTDESISDDPTNSQQNARMGIGLFQAARQATEVGYDLSLSANAAGHVEFTLKKR